VLEVGKLEEKIWDISLTLSYTASLQFDLHFLKILKNSYSTENVTVNQYFWWQHHRAKLTMDETSAVI
jgi:hypothetical protein